MLKYGITSNYINPKVLTLNDQEFISGNFSLNGLKIGPYILQTKLGQGSFGTVFAGFEESTKTSVAIKVIDLEVIQRQKDPQIKIIKTRLIKSQTETMIKCNSQNLIKCLDVLQNKSFKIIVLEYCNEGTLQDKINNLKTIQELQAIQYLKQILNGLTQLHRHGIIHRDLKTQNILLHDDICKIADFGFSKDLFSNNWKYQIHQTNLGTLCTMAPEVIQGRKYGLQADMWSIGIIYYKMLYGRYPFQSNSRKQILSQIKNKIFFESKLTNKGIKISEQSKSFILECLDLHSQKRLNWSNILKHKIFQIHSNQSFSSFKSSRIQNLDGSNTILDMAKMKGPDKSKVICYEQNDSFEAQEDQITPEFVRVVVTRADYVIKKQEETKDLVQNMGYPWSKVTNFECLRVEFILQQVVENIQFCPSRLSQSQQIIEVLFLIVIRCFQDISIKYWQIQANKEKVIPSFIQVVQNSYQKVEEKFDIYFSRVSKKDKEHVSVIRNKLLGFFEGQQCRQKAIFLNVRKDKCSNGVLLGPYTRQEQIGFTQKFLDRYFEKISKQGQISKGALNLIKNYERICSLTLKDVGSVYFKTFLTNLYIKQ